MIRRGTATAFFLGASLAFAAKTTPYLSGPVIDDLGMLNASEVRQLDQYIREQKDLVQMQVWITGLEGEAIESVSYRAAKEWKLGTEKGDNGVLLLVAPKEKQMRLEVGRGLEGDIPDILAGRILDYVARPNFREGRFFKGIFDSLQEVVVLAGKGPEAGKLREKLTEKPGRKFDFFTIVQIIFVLLFLRPLFWRRRRSHGLWAVGSSGFWGGGGGGFGGGGGWSGGGGSFSGGGSSSSW